MSRVVVGVKSRSHMGLCNQRVYAFVLLGSDHLKEIRVPHGLDPRANVLQMVRSHVAHRPPASLAPISRLNTKLETNGYPPMRSLVQDLSDGVRLIQLMVRSTLVSCTAAWSFTPVTSQQEIMGNCRPSPA
jgi:hypothetical protein